jgi:hypothetical protein
MRADVCAIAPYVYGKSLEELRGAGLTQAKAWVAEELARARSAGLPLIAYEGGQDSFELGQPALRAPAARPRHTPAVQRDARCTLAAAGLRGPFMHYTHSGSCWRLRVHSGDSPEASPKYQGLLDWLQHTKSRKPAP